MSSKVYFKTGGYDALINLDTRPKTEKREGSNADHVIFTDHEKELADHTVTVQGVTFHIKEINAEGYTSNKLIPVYLSKEAVIALADKIKIMDGSVFNIKYQEENDDLPF